jgi:hypothetical protein
MPVRQHDLWHNASFLSFPPRYFSDQGISSFCPNGMFPPPPKPKPTALHPNGNHKKCLDVRGAIFENGTPVQMSVAPRCLSIFDPFKLRDPRYDCNQTPAQQWFIHRGSTKVKVAGVDFCLDAGSSKPNLPQYKADLWDTLRSRKWRWPEDLAMFR